MAIVTYAYKVIWASVKTLEQDKLVNENHKYDMDKYWSSKWTLTKHTACKLSYPDVSTKSQIDPAPRSENSRTPGRFNIVLDSQGVDMEYRSSRVTLNQL